MMQHRRKIFLILGFWMMAVMNSAQSEKLVIDTDAGGDDAVSILLVLNAWKANESDFELVGITCTYGNTAEENVENNVLQILTVAGMTQIPVYGGAKKPLTGNMRGDHFYGTNGFGDFEFNGEVTAAVNRSQHAAMSLVDLARKYRGDLNVLVLGPLTNVALAVVLDPDFSHNVKRFYVMGGSVSGIGNIAPGIEFNFAADPESNFILFNAIEHTPVRLLPWEMCIEVIALPMVWRTDVLGSSTSKTMQFLNKAEGKVLHKGAVWKAADVLATAFMLWPHLIRKSIVLNITPVFDGAAKGAVLVDYRHRSGKISNTEIIQDGDIEGLKSQLLKYLGKDD